MARSETPPVTPESGHTAPALVLLDWPSALGRPRPYNGDMSDLPRPRVVLLADRSRPEIAAICSVLRQTMARHAELVRELPPDGQALPRDLEADLAVVVGGDGTLIRQARRLADHDIPLIGVNVGRLGFLAEFDAQSFAEQAESIFGSSPQIHQYTLLRTVVRDADGAVKREDVAANDCVISAGEPFRMIELRVSVDDAEGPTLTGDGVIVATPIGSTAYNVSAGGPIVYPTMQAMVITPLAAHSLAFRPIVLAGDAVLRIQVLRANEGTALVPDGQATVALTVGDIVEIRQHERTTRFVANGETTYWGILLDKLRWAAPPTYRDRGR